MPETKTSSQRPLEGARTLPLGHGLCCLPVFQQVPASRAADGRAWHEEVGEGLAPGCPALLPRRDARSSLGPRPPGSAHPHGGRAVLVTGQGSLPRGHPARQPLSSKRPRDGDQAASTQPLKDREAPPHPAGRDSTGGPPRRRGGTGCRPVHPPEGEARRPDTQALFSVMTTGWGPRRAGSAAPGAGKLGPRRAEVSV